MRNGAEGVELHRIGEIIGRVHRRLGQLIFRIAVNRIGARIAGDQLGDSKRGAIDQAGLQAGAVGAYASDFGVGTAILGEVAILLFDGEADEALVEERKAHIGGQIVAGAAGLQAVGGVNAAAIKIIARGGGKCAARGFFLEDDVDDAGNGVGAVLGGGAVQQHFDVIDRRFRNQRNVGGRGAGRKAAAIDLQVAGVVTALAVHQNQCVVGRQAAESGGERQVGGVAAELLRGEGGNGLAQSLAKVVGARALGQGVAAQHGDGRGAVGGRHALHARAGDDYGFLAAGILLRHGGRGGPRERGGGCTQQQSVLQVELGRCEHVIPFYVFDIETRPKRPNNALKLREPSPGPPVKKRSYGL